MIVAPLTEHLPSTVLSTENLFHLISFNIALQGKCSYSDSCRSRLKERAKIAKTSK